MYHIFCICGTIFLKKKSRKGGCSCKKCFIRQKKSFWCRDVHKRQVWGKAGIQLQSASLPAHIRPMEAVALFAKWNGTKPDAAMLDALGIGGMKKTQYGALSTGQKRRLHLALALTGRPDVVFLDEPTAGLDVEGRVALHAQIRALQAQGKTIVLASHDTVSYTHLDVYKRSVWWSSRASMR